MPFLSIRIKLKAQRHMRVLYLEGKSLRNIGDRYGLPPEEVTSILGLPAAPPTRAPPPRAAPVLVVTPEISKDTLVTASIDLLLELEREKDRPSHRGLTPHTEAAVTSMRIALGVHEKVEMPDDFE